MISTGDPDLDRMLTALSQSKFPDLHQIEVRKQGFEFGLVELRGIVATEEQKAAAVLAVEPHLKSRELINNIYVDTPPSQQKQAYGDQPLQPFQCKEATRHLVHYLLQPQALPANVRRTVAVHLTKCRDCRLELQAMESALRNSHEDLAANPSQSSPEALDSGDAPANGGG